MLRPAQLYADELSRLHIESWYNEEYIYFDYGLGSNVMEGLPDNNIDTHQFVSVDRDDSVIGYIGYDVDWAAKSVSGFSAVNYFRGNPMDSTFVEDLKQSVFDIFLKYGMNRLEFGCVADNPAIRGYRRLVSMMGGREVGTLRQSCMLQDGKLHDSVIFEVMAEDFKMQCSLTHSPLGILSRRKKHRGGT